MPFDAMSHFPAPNPGEIKKSVDQEVAERKKQEGEIAGYLMHLQQTSPDDAVRFIRDFGSKPVAEQYRQVEAVKKQAELLARFEESDPEAIKERLKSEVVDRAKAERHAKEEDDAELESIRLAMAGLGVEAIKTEKGEVSLSGDESRRLFSNLKNTSRAIRTDQALKASVGGMQEEDIEGVLSNLKAKPKELPPDEEIDDIFNNLKAA